MDNEMVEKLESMDPESLARIKGEALGKLSKQSPEAFQKLSEVDFFNIQGLDFVIEDGKFLISDDLIGTIPEDEDTEKIKMASGFIRNYLKCLGEALLNENQAVSSDVDWLETFLIGVVEHRR